MVTGLFEVGVELPFTAVGRIQVEAFYAWIYREVISRAHIFPSRLKSTQWTLLPMGYLIKRDTHTHFW